ncbi:hypothetical protein ACWELV_46225, partial [Streptomyces mirabilis]
SELLLAPPVVGEVRGEPVPQRVAALLAAPGRRPRAAAWIALLLVACATVSASAAATGVLTFHHEVEIAQGEETH